MRRYLAVVIAFIICMSPAHVWAASSGNIQVVVPDDMKEVSISYTKVAERDELDEDKVEEWLQQDVKYTDTVYGTELANMEDGVYKVQVEGDSEYDFVPAIVSIPLWSEEMQCMDYEYEIIPKYIRKVKPVEIKDAVIPDKEVPTIEEVNAPQRQNELSPLTEDGSKGVAYIGIGIISLIIIWITSCHNRFNCDTMTDKYSKKRRI